MAQFRYAAKDQAGQSSKGIVTADTQSEAIKQLRDHGLIVLNMSETKNAKSGQSKGGFSIFNRVSDKDKIVFTQQLAIMSEAGLPITQALHSLIDETPNKALVKVIQAISNDVEGGTALSAAFAKHPAVFSNVYVNILKAGEKSGKVDEVLTRLSAQLEKDNDVKSKVKGALAYPVFVMIAMFVIVGFIMVFIIPQIESVFVENNAQLPGITKVIIAISNFIRHDYLILIGSIIAIVLAYYYYGRTERGHYNIDLLKLHIPIFGPLIKRVSIARFARIFSTLLAAGIPMLEIFETSNEVVGNEVFKRELTQAAKDIENGLEISAALKKGPNIPHMVVQLTAVGEKSGNIDLIYNNLANFMEKEVDNTTRNMTALLEPILMLVMGAVVGTIVIAVLLPIYSLTSSIN